MKLIVRDNDFLPHLACDVEFELGSGEMHCLVGPNGVGKSTLAKRIFNDHPASISYIEQGSLDFFYDRTLKKIKWMFLEAVNLQSEKNKFLNLWETFNLNLKEDRSQSSLSGGEGQLLKLCMGLASSKQILLLDEPSQYLDQEMKKILADKLTSEINAGKSVMMIEHDLTWLKDMKVIELFHENQTLKVKDTWNI